MNVLLVEDDILLSQNIEKVFKNKALINRFKSINSYEDFLKELDIINSYDILIIDIYLWNKVKTWIDIIKIIRKKNNRIPIIMISWCDELNMIAKAFDTWASDYIIKPFRLKELEIRIFKWFKDYFLSIKFFENNTIGYSWIIYNIKENQFYFKWNKVKLSKQNKYLLSIFISHSEKFLTKKFLIDKIWWDISEYDSRNIRVNILRLRKDLEKVWMQDYVQNIRWEWYIFTK